VSGSRYSGIVEATHAAELDVYGRMPLSIERGAGCRVWDVEGNEYLDLYGGHAVCSTGHCHPRVVRAVQEQAERLLFYSSAVYNGTRACASVGLAGKAPVQGSRVFHCCSGAEANEVALKIARKTTGRPKVISFEGSFHGRTLGALGVCGMPKYRETAGGVLPGHHVSIPMGDDAALDAALDGDTAAVICEPIQSLAGIYMAEEAWYARLAEKVEAAGALLIFDEVQCGMGRTGTFFIAEGLGVRPHVITLAKGIGSGVPAAAAVVRPDVAERVERGDQGSTFGGGPLAMAAVGATVAVIEEEGLADNAARLGAMIREEASALAGVREVRGRGLLLGIECDRPAKDVQAALLERRIITGSSAHPHTLRLLPPLVLTEGEARRFIEALGAVLQEEHA
jgi:acetylornithine/succinyldiaminopimelate/putrescine aminotransferase